MAFNFVTANNQYIYCSSSPVAAKPLTAAMLVLSDGVSGQYIYVGDLSGTHRVQGQGLSSNAPYNQFIDIAANGTATASNLTQNLATGSWFSVGGIAYSSSSRSVIAKGAIVGNETTNSGSSSPYTGIGIGARYSNGWGTTFQGKLCECAIWNAALTDAEVASLAKGFSPRRIRPQSLVFYAPLLRNLQDLRQGLALTAVNSPTVANHPRVY